MDKDTEPIMMSVLKNQSANFSEFNNESDFDKKLYLIVEGLLQSGWGRIGLSLRDSQFNLIKFLTAGFTEEENSYIRENTLPTSTWVSFFSDSQFEQFRSGSCYFIPEESEWSQAMLGRILPDTQASGKTKDAWHPNDILWVLLHDSKQQKIGMITLDRPQNNLRPTSETLRPIELYAQFAASVIENARLAEEALRRNHELESYLEDIVERERFYNALGNVSLAINYTLELDKVLDLICSESIDIFNVGGTFIWQQEGEDLVCRAAKGLGADEYVGTAVSITNPATLASIILQSGNAQYINNVQDPNQTQLILPQPKAAQAALGVPLEQDEQIIGVLLLVEHHNPQRFQEKDIARAIQFAVQAALALRNATLFAEQRHFNAELDKRVARRTHDLNEESNRVKVLLRITSELSSSLDQTRVLDQALLVINEAVNATQGFILIVDPQTNELMYRAAFGTALDIPPTGLASGIMASEGLIGQSISTQTSILIGNLQRTETQTNHILTKSHRSIMLSPLCSNEDILGILILCHTKSDIFNQQQLDLVNAAAVQVANAISNANLYLLIRDQAERLGTLFRLEQIESTKSQAILESIADGVLVTDSENKIVLANHTAATLLGILRENLIGRTINEFLGLYAQTNKPWLKSIRNWSRNSDQIEPGSFLTDQFTIESKIISIHLSPVLYDRQFFGTVSIFRDITERVELDQMKSEFVSNVSHELRTPMTSIMGYVDLLMLGAVDELTETQRNFLQIVKNNVDRLKILVNDLLSISQIETGQARLALGSVDIRELINRVLEGHLRSRIDHEHKAIEVATEFEEPLLPVYADDMRVIQVLTNLVDNAFNYIHERGEITIKTQTNGEYVYISVIDSGIGIPEEDKKRIFDRFYRADHQLVRSVPGTGLGLAIVHSLVQMHGGDLTFKSEINKGSTFTFSLPINQKGM